MDRVSVYTEENPDNKLTLSYSYYVANKKLKTLLEEINGHPRGASYVYDNDERLESYQKANGKREYTYDDFDRIPSYVTSHKNIEGRFVTVLTTAFTFASSAVSTTSTCVASMSQAGNGFSQNYSYTYDKNGNILSVTDPNGTTTYEYDSLGQLLRENNFAGNFTHVWEYDRAGNILSRKEYAYTTGTISENTPYNDIVIYGYNDDKGWGDLLTSYDGEPIFYDEIGNPERIGDLTLTWQHGRQLASLTSGETTWTYTYNADGLRTKRTDGTNTYEYVYYNGLLQYMEYNNTPVYFTHAPDGTPMGMLTGGKAYFYITNLQGDVVGIVDATGNLVVSYTYDAWGNPLSTTVAPNNTDAANIGAINPIRYRGYVYDSETGLYYLQSRYYNSENGRFINADAYASTGQGFAGHNMFVYCGNNPVMGYDPSGLINWGGVVAGLVIGVFAVAAIAATVATAGAASPLVAAAGTAVGTAVSSALVEAAVVTTTGAIAETPVVYDITLTNGYERTGYSMVYDFGENTVDPYWHTGSQNKREYGLTFGTGYVYNYNKSGDYSGTFIDANFSVDFRGANLGVDTCTDPNNINTSAPFCQGSAALLLTSGMSVSFGNQSASPAVALDYYFQLISTN